ncbi:MAG: nucleoside hydrolase [Bacteroidota bacterium]|nr:nucleoside hydrolase [Bacteroidota bacterium]MDP4190238.1 nucleoside hydrolase [Bacteroidota bacterium]MDP4195556.1 nucleoside hydrolase [Bacteroidota bacterium]
MGVKILLDTDIGTDIDDAVCLAYLLANPECELMGITTVTGEAEKRAMLASMICKAAGKEIPIYPGSNSPILIQQGQTVAQQAHSLARWPHQKKFPKGEAIEFMRRTIRNNPGEIVLLTIAPLTNIGLLFSVDPEIPSLLKGLVMMGGYFERKIGDIGPLEWNIMGDYHASDIVYRADIRMHRSVGLDVTTSVVMSPEEFRRAFDFPIFEPVHDLSQYWFTMYNGTTFHDPLAAATIFDSEICSFSKGNVEIEMNDIETLGLTKWDPENSSPRHEVALKVNSDRFFQHYISVFK